MNGTTARTDTSAASAGNADEHARLSPAAKRLLDNTHFVGGAIRDELLGLTPKDIDLVVVDEHGFDHMVRDLETLGFKVHTVKPDTLTVRVRVPESLRHIVPLRDADFNLAREDGPYSDGRHPDWTRPGTLKKDLARRDFTVNAFARRVGTDTIIDLHGGLDDLKSRTLRFVGDPEQRIREDGLRSLRALRFAITKGFTLHPETWSAVTGAHAVDMLVQLPADRVRDELFKMFVADTVGSMRLLVSAPAIMEFVLDAAGPLWLKPTLEAR